MARTKSWNQVIRKAIRDSGLSLYAVARDSGCNVAPIQRFMAKEHGMTVETLERVAPIVGIELRVKRRPKSKARRPERKGR